jgi:hypothetical protein
MLAPESFCDPYNVVITKANGSDILHSIDPHIHTIYTYLHREFTHQGLTPSTTFQHDLIMVDKTSRHPYLAGLNDYTTYLVITANNEFTVSCRHPVTIEHINTIKINATAGSHFTSKHFR